MNKLFQKSGKRKIDLDESYYLNVDNSSNGTVLVFFEPRTKTNKEGQEENYVFEDKWYFTKVSQSLEKYTELVENSGSTIKEILENSAKTREVIEEFSKTFKDF